jgi:hypothetical protein
VSPTARRIRAGIAVLAVVVLIALAVLKSIGIDERLFRILALAGGLLVGSLYVTYRALLNMVEALRETADPPPTGARDEDNR